MNKLCDRIHSWYSLRRKEKNEKRIAIILYGFPPGVGATGTAALLNVPKSLENLLKRLRCEGYNIPQDIDGEKVIKLLEKILEPQYVSSGSESVKKIGQEEVGEGNSMGVLSEEISPSQLRTWLNFPLEY